jgi:CheY-like chemotaxis protein
MTKPLALVLYEKLLPGSQLVNRLHDLGYRVQNVTEAALLQETAEREKPLVLIVDLQSRRASVPEAIARLKKNPATEHIPVLAFGGDLSQQLREAGRAAGANLIASDTGLLEQLPHLLDQVLHID